MATIKRNGAKVVIKDGKVACGCCDVGCCMYPAQALFDGLYTADDLPDSLTIVSGLFEQIMTKTGGLSPAYSGESSEISLPESGVIAWDIFYNPGDGGETLQFGQFCLVDGVFVKDQFADTYTATSPSAETVTLTRESLCVWEGPEPEFYTLRYFDDSATTGFQCKWLFIDSLKDEGQFQNIPTGDYTQPDDEDPWVIS